MGETMIYVQGYAHDHRLPHLQRRWATRQAYRLTLDDIHAALRYAAGLPKERIVPLKVRPRDIV